MRPGDAKFYSRRKQKHFLIATNGFKKPDAVAFN